MATDWSKLEFEQMYDGVHKEDAGRQRLSADSWVAYATKLEALSGNLAHYRDSFKRVWDSAAGDAFFQHITDMVGSIDTAAANARGYANILRETADAVEHAQQEMNKLSKERTGYLREKDDYNNLGDDNDAWHDTLDFFDDVGHNIGGWFDSTGGNNIDPKKLEEFKNRAITLMKELGTKYLNAESHRAQMPKFKGPQAFQPVLPPMAVPSAPGLPGAPPTPTAGPPPVMPTPPTPVLPPPPVVPKPPVVPVADVPAPPKPPALPPAPTLPGQPVLPVPPLIPGIGPNPGPGLGPGKLGKTSMPPAPSGKLGQTGLPPMANPSRSGVIGERPSAGQPGKTGMPPAAGPGKTGKTGLPPAAGKNAKTGQPPPAGKSIGDKPGRSGLPPTAGGARKGPGKTGRTAIPPSAEDRNGVIGRRPGGPPGLGADRTGIPPAAGDGRGVLGRQPGDPGHGGLPPSRRGRVADPRDPIGNRGVAEPAGPRSPARGTPPPTISNRSADPMRPVNLDHDTLGGRPGTRGGALPPGGRRGVPGATTGDGEGMGRRPGIAARNAAAPPVVRNTAPDPKQQDEQWRPARRHLADVDDSEFAVTEQVAAPPVIETPERAEHGREDRGPAIGQAG